MLGLAVVGVIFALALQAGLVRLTPEEAAVLLAGALAAAVGLIVRK